MKIFISYKFEGENLIELEKMITSIISSLESKGHEVLTTFFDGQKLKSNKEIMDLALSHIAEADAQLIILTSENKSEGLLLEAGYAMAKNKKIILALKKGIKTKWLQDYASEIITFKDMEDLYKKLGRIE